MQIKFRHLRFTILQFCEECLQNKKNGVDLDRTKFSVRPLLKMDPKTESFIGNDRATAMLTRDYRKGLVVPKPAYV